MSSSEQAPLRLSEFGIGRLWEAVREAIIVADASTEQIVLWNSVATEVFGYEQDEAVGMQLHELVPHRLRDDHWAGIARYRETGHGRYIDAGTILELPALRKDGSEIVIEMSLAPIENISQPGQFALAVIRDVSERKELEAAREDFMTMVAHDVKAPLTVVTGCLSVLSNSWERLPRERIDEVLGVMEQGLDRAAALIDDLVEASRLEAGQGTLEAQPFSISELATRIVGQLTTAQADREFELRLPHDLPPALGDERHTARVLENILTNAIKYSETGSSIEVVAAHEGDSVVMEVVDHGFGLRAQDLPHVFSKFTRSRDDPSAPKGSGLGLYVARLFVEAQGGSIAVASTHGEGSTFTVSLPAAASPA